MTTSHDIIIVGGGMIGAALACALAQQTALSIAVLEAQPAQTAWLPQPYHHRVSTIALSSQRFFQSLGVWDAMQQKRVSPFTQMEVWDAQGQGKIHFNSADIAESVLGYVIENAVMQSALWEKMQQYAHIDYVSSVQLTSFMREQDNVLLGSAGGRLFSAPLIIAADGAHSWLRRQAGIAIVEQNYVQTAIVATVQTELPHEQTASQVFLESGPLAFLPLAEATTASIVWSLKTEEAERLMALDSAAFAAALAQAFSLRLGAVLQVGERYTFALRSQQATQYVKPSIALIGDAAHCIHPLAGQGVNMGLLDAEHLANILITTVKNHRNFASFATLRRYERWCKAEHWAMFQGVEWIKTLFDSRHAAIHRIRSLGWNAVNQTAWIKRRLMRYAVGNR